MIVEDLLQQAVVLHQKGDLAAALKLYQAILNEYPMQADAWHLSGLVYHNNNDNALAIKCIKKAISISEQAIFYNNLGNVYFATKNYQEAIIAYQQALTLKYSPAELHYKIGNCYYWQEQYQSAKEQYIIALDFAPAFALAMNNLGNIYKFENNYELALKFYLNAINSQGDLIEALSNAADIYNKIGDYLAAINYAKQALAIKSNYIPALNHLAFALKLSGDALNAIQVFLEIHALCPDNLEVLFNLGVLFFEIDDLDSALEYFTVAYKLAPDNALIASKYYYLSRILCQWDELPTIAIILDALKAESPYVNVLRTMDLASNLTVASNQATIIEKNVLAFKDQFDYKIVNPKRVVLGYLSSDFKDHATMHLMARMFELHNKDQFKVIIYSYGVDDDSWYRHKLQRDCDEFHDISNLPYFAAAKKINQDGVDILIDLKGYSQGSRLEIAALRPAKIQINYLGFPGTIGAKFFDYIIADKILIKKEEEQFYAEKVLYMPHCYQVTDNLQPVAQHIYSKAECNLPDDSFVFCAPHQTVKLDPVMFASWMRILSNVPHAVLWLLAQHDSVKRNLMLMAAKHGIDPERIIFMPYMKKAWHLARLKLADLVLDTMIYNGHTTTSDALFVGIPVLTLEGKHFASRVSSSILTALNMPELITHSLSAYEERAIHYALAPQDLALIKDKIIYNKTCAPLFNTVKFVYALEQLYLSCIN